MRVKGYHFSPPKTYLPKYQESEETKKIRRLSQEIKQIKRENQYIAEHGKAPTKTPDYYKKRLNII